MRTDQQVTTDLTTKAEGVIDLTMAFMTALPQFDLLDINRFLDVVPENGEALWLRFTARRDSDDTQPNYCFTDFILEAIADPQPEPSPTPTPA